LGAVAPRTKLKNNIYIHVSALVVVCKLSDLQKRGATIEISVDFLWKKTAGSYLLVGFDVGVMMMMMMMIELHVKMTQG